MSRQSVGPPRGLIGLLCCRMMMRLTSPSHRPHGMHSDERPHRTLFVSSVRMWTGNGSEVMWESRWICCGCCRTNKGEQCRTSARRAAGLRGWRASRRWGASRCGQGAASRRPRRGRYHPTARGQSWRVRPAMSFEGCPPGRCAVGVARSTGCRTSSAVGGANPERTAEARPSRPETGLTGTRWSSLKERGRPAPSSHQGPISAAEWVVHLTRAYSNRCDLQERLQDALRKLARSGEGSRRSRKVTSSAGRPAARLLGWMVWQG